MTTNYSFEVLAIILEVTDRITFGLATYLQKMKTKNVKTTIDRCQKKSLLVTLKKVKSVMNMKST